MNLIDLHNPDGIRAILPNNSSIPIGLNTNQGWQETKGRWELWEWSETLSRLRFIRGWNKKAVVSVYG